MVGLMPACLPACLEDCMAGIQKRIGKNHYFTSSPTIRYQKDYKSAICSCL
jgi:hypothetical protein